MKSIFEALETLPVSEECYNDIINMIESILSEAEGAPETTEQKPKIFQKEEDYANPEKRLAFCKQQLDHYTNGEGRRHPYAKQLVSELKKLHKLQSEEVRKARAAKQPVQV